MATNINIAVNVDDNGTTAQATAEAKKLRQALQDAATAAAGVRVPQATAAARQGVAARAAAAQPGGGASDTNLSRGIGGMTGASGRDFAAQAQGLGGLVHVYATFAANLYAVSAAFGALSKAADTANIILGLDQLGAASGRSLGTLAKSMVAATDGAISLRQAMTSTAMATAGGMSSKAILEMTTVAKNASLALGRDMTDSMDRLTKGIIKIQPELLDELGIMARVIPAQQAYAREMGKSVGALTDFEKRQAFMNAVLKEGTAKFKEINIAANPYSKLTASLADLSQSALTGINTVLGPLILFLAESPTGLTMAVGTLAGLLLKQAIPALGQYKKSIEDIQRLNLEKAANKSDVLTDTGMYDLAQADRSKQAYLNRNNYATQSAQVQTKLLKESENIHAATLAKNEARSNSFLGHETTNTRIINRAYVDAAQSNIRADVAQTQSRYGLVAAFKRLNEEIKVSKDTGQLLKLGKDVDALAPKTEMLRNGFMRLTGGIMILGSAIGTIIEAFAPWLILIGVLAAGFSFLIDHFSKAKEESGKASKAFDTVNSAFTTLGNTLDAINRKPLLEQLSQASIQAKANAVNELVDGVQSLAEATAKADSKMGFWDKFSDFRISSSLYEMVTGGFINGTANLSDKFTSSKQMAEGMEKALIGTAKAIADSPGEQALKASIKNILGISYKDTNQLEKALSDLPDGLIKKTPLLMEALKAANKTLAETAQIGQTLKDSWDAAGKSWDNIITSFSTTDPLGKLGEDALNLSIDLQKAFNDPKASIAELISMAGDFKKLRMMDPNTAKDLMQFGFEAEKVQKTVATLTENLDKQRKAASEAAANLAKQQKAATGPINRELGAGIGMPGGMPMPKNVGATVDSKALLAAQQQLNAAELGVRNTEKQIALENNKLKNGDLLVRAQRDIYKFAAQALSNSLEQGSAKAAINLQKALLTGATGLASINLNADLQKKDIDLQVKALGGQAALITATERLTLVTEQATIQREREEANAEPDLIKRAKLLNNLDARSKQVSIDANAQGQPLSVLRNQANAKGGEGIETQTAAQRALGPALQREVVRGQQALLLQQKISVEIDRQYKAQGEIARVKQSEYDVTLSNLSLEQARLDSQQKYMPYLTQEEVVKKNNLELSTIAFQNLKTEADLQGKITAALEAQAFAKKQKGVTPETLNTRQQEVDNAKIALAQQSSKYSNEISKREIQNQQDILTAAKTRYEYQIAKEKALIDLGIASKQNSLEIDQIRLSAMGSLKAFTESQLASQQTVIDMQKEDIAQAKARIDLQDSFRSKISALALQLSNIKDQQSEAAAATRAAILAESDAYTQTRKNITDTSNERKRAIDLVGEYTAAIAKLNETEQLNAAKRDNAMQGVSGLEATGQISAETAAKQRYMAAEQARQAALEIATQGAASAAAAERSKVGGGDATELAKIQAQLDLQTKISEQKKIGNDMTQELAVYQSNVNRLLADQAYLTETASKFTENMSIAFGDLGTAIGSATEALTKMATDTIAYETERNRLVQQRQNAEGDPAAKAKIDQDIARNEAKNTTNQLANTIKLIGSTKKFFDQKSMGYKILGNLEKVSAAITAVTQAKELAMTASTALAKIGINIPAIYASFMAQLGPWGTAAAATAMAAVGINAFNGGSTKTDFANMTGKTSEERQKTQGTGGVFGDSETKTTTIVNSLELLAKNSIEGLNYDNELLKAMRRVADSIIGAAKSIYASPSVRTGGFGTALKDTNKAAFTAFGDLGSSLGLGSIGGAIDNILGSMFGGGTSSTQKITSAGLQLQGTFDQVMNDTTGSIKQFKDVLTETHTDGGWFGQDSSSSSLSRQTQQLGKNTSQAIADIFGNANAMFVELGKKTNVSATQIQTILQNYDISMPIDLMNKTGQELVDELNAVIGEKISGAAEKIFTGFTKYRDFGEDYLATVLRVVDGNDKVNQSLLSIGHAFSIIGRFDISEDMIKIAGGLEAFQNQTAFFRDNFLSAAEKLAPVQQSVNNQLTKLGISTAITRDQYKQLVQAQNLSTQSGRDMHQNLMELAPGFDIVTKALDDLANKSLDLEAKIYELIGQKSAALAISRNKELAAMDASLRPRQIFINALTDEIAIRDRLKSAYDSSNKSVNAAIVSLNNYKTALLAGSASLLTPAQKYADATAIFKATAQAAAATITTSSTAADIATRDEAVAKLSSVSDSFLANSKEMNAGTTQYATDLALVTTAVNDATTAMGTQLSDAALQLGFLNTIATATQTTADILAEYLAAQGVTKIAQTTSAASGSVASTFQIPGHADGGLAQGISIVGENGPEIVDFKNPGRVYSNQASNDIFSTKELVEEIKALRKEVADLRSDQKEQTGHLITSTYDANMKNAEAIATANQDALNNQNWNTRSKVKVA